MIDGSAIAVFVAVFVVIMLAIWSQRRGSGRDNRGG